jgi:hypothetical protein
MPTILFPLSDDLYSDRENHMISYLRSVLNDTDEACQIFDDAQLFAYIDLALQDVNSHPTKTFYTLDSVPRDWINVIILGAYVFALQAQSITEKARNFTVGDQGINYNPPDLPGHMMNIAQQNEAKYQAEKERIKANERPALLGIGSTRTLVPNPNFVRMRHLRSRRFF